MALKGVKGPDRVLYSLVSLLQNKLPGVIVKYNKDHKAICLFTFPGDELVLSKQTLFKFQNESHDYEITFPQGSYNTTQIATIINNGNTPLSAAVFSYGILLSCDTSWKVLETFGNLKTGQCVNNIALQNIQSYIMNGVLPDESQAKAYPSIVVELNSINPSPDTIMCEYSVSLTVGVTSAVNTSQVDYLSNQLFKYYDCISEVLTVIDDGGLGGTCNGLNIISANIGEATGNSYFLKYLTITLSISVEED